MRNLISDHLPPDTLTPLFNTKVPLKADINFFYPRPAYHYVASTKGATIKPEFCSEFYVQKPDIDNCVKFVLDTNAGNCVS